MTLIAPFTVGVFEVTDLGVTPNGRKWRCRNTRTTLTHATYGTEEEVRASLTKQSADWERIFFGKKTKGKPGDAWRDASARKGASGG